jgi:TRAP-type C4-dicarboxylate transport system substrate-binding protein
MHKLSKSSITTGAATAVIGGAAVYQTLTPEQKRMAQQEALNGSKKVFQRWQNLSPETKQSFKQKAAGFAGKAKSLWSRLPSQ